MAWQHQWGKHPTVRRGDQLSLGEKAADKMRNGMGSWPFVFVFFAVMIIWAVVNGVLHVGGGSGFDPYPFILLNLFLSMLAGIQAAALLIAAKRADAVASEVAGDGRTERVGHGVWQLLPPLLENRPREAEEGVVGSGAAGEGREGRIVIVP